MFNYIVLLLGLLYASYTDLKERIVPDKLNYLMIAIGILYHAYLSFTSSSITPIALSISGALIAFVFSYVLWRIGAWAGGDVKLFTALGALAPGIELPIFPFIIFINSIILSFPFIMLYIFYKTLRKKSLRKIFKKMLLHGTEQGLILAAFTTGFLYLLPIFNIPSWFSLPLTFLAFILPKTFRYALALLIGIPGLINSSEALLLYPSALVMTLFWQAITYGKQYVLRTKTAVSKLTEGMIAAETLYLSNKKPKQFLPTLKQKLSLYEPKHTIISMYKAAGIEKSEITSLKKHKIKSIWIKESTPMVPIFFFGALAAILYGNLLVLIIQYL